MSDKKQLPILITNLDEYKELVKKFVSLFEQLQNFEFKFSDEVISRNTGLCSEQLNQE
jgi:hypothetical protein